MHEESLEVVDLNVHYTINANQNAGIQAKIYSLLGPQAQIGADLSDDLRSKRVVRVHAASSSSLKPSNPCAKSTKKSLSTCLNLSAARVLRIGLSP